MIKILLKDSIKLLRFATIAKLCGMKIERRGRKVAPGGQAGGESGRGEGRGAGQRQFNFKAFGKRERKNVNLPLDNRYLSYTEDENDN